MPQPTVLRNPETDEAMRSAKNCPFCGTIQGHEREMRFVRIEKRIGGEEWYYVSCWQCGARAPSEITPGEAIRTWNRRQEQAWHPLGPVTVLLPSPQQYSHLMVWEGGQQVSFIDYIEEEVSEKKDGIAAKVDINLGKYRISQRK